MISYTNFRKDVPTVELAQVVEFLDSKRKPITEKNRITGPYPYYGANGVQDYVADWIFDEDLILLAEDGGHFENPDRGVAYKITGKTWVNNHAHVLRAKKVDVDYLKHVLKNMDLMPYVNGATRLKLTKSSAEKIKIPLPPLAEQKRIAAILDKAAEIKAKREQAIAKLSELSQNIFLDFVGDLYTNSKNLPLIKLKDVCSYSQGIQVDVEKQSSIKRTENDVRFLRIIDFTQGNQEPRYIDHPGERYFLDKDEIAMVRYGATGFVCTGLSGIIANNLFKINVNDERFERKYVLMYLKSNFFQAKLKAINIGVAMPAINFKTLDSFDIPLLPAQTQKSLVELNEDIANNVSVINKSLFIINSLIQSLQHQAFTAGFNA